MGSEMCIRDRLIGSGLLYPRDAQRCFKRVLTIFEPIETDKRDAFEAMEFCCPSSLPLCSWASNPSLAAVRADR